MSWWFGKFLADPRFGVAAVIFNAHQSAAEQIGEHLQAVSIHPRADGSYAIAHDQAGWAEVQACQLVSPPGYAAAVAWLSTH